MNRFTKGEIVLIRDTERFFEAMRVESDNYGRDTVMIRYGAFQTAVAREAVHKCPASIKRLLKLEDTKDNQHDK
jgi:hypothetical protein